MTGKSADERSLVLAECAHMFKDAMYKDCGRFDGDRLWLGNLGIPGQTRQNLPDLGPAAPRRVCQPCLQDRRFVLSASSRRCASQRCWTRTCGQSTLRRCAPATRTPQPATGLRANARYVCRSSRSGRCGPPACRAASMPCASSLEQTPHQTAYQSCCEQLFKCPEM